MHLVLTVICRRNERKRVNEFACVYEDQSPQKIYSVVQEAFSTVKFPRFVKSFLQRKLLQQTSHLPLLKLGFQID